MKMYCPVCGKEQDIILVQKKETYPVRGTKVDVDADVCTCSECGEEILNIDVDDANLERAYNVYRFQKGLLFPSDIKRIREKYGVSQVQFARILGLGEKTIARYENGSLQDEAQNNLILLSDDPAIFATLKDRYEQSSKSNGVNAFSAYHGEFQHA